MRVVANMLGRYPLASLRDGINYAYSRALHSTPFCTGCNLTGTFGSCFARDEEDEEEDASAGTGGRGKIVLADARDKEARGGRKRET